MLLGFKTELKLNNQPRTQSLKYCGVSRHAWNWRLALIKQMLDDNKDNPTNIIKFPTPIDLHGGLVARVKSECSRYYECSKSAPDKALRALKTAWNKCFQKTASAPRFQKIRSGRHDIFTLEGAVHVFENNKIQVPKIFM